MESGLTQKIYCESLGIKRSTFANWVKRSKEKANMGFVSITPPPSGYSEAIEILYPNGVRIKAAATDLKTISALINLY